VDAEEARGSTLASKCADSYKRLRASRAPFYGPEWCAFLSRQARLSQQGRGPGAGGRDPPWIGTGDQAEVRREGFRNAHQSSLQEPHT
jgi:hypothetical protein